MIKAGALSNLAGILCGQGKFSEAVAPNEEALQILDKVLGTDNEYTLSTLANCLKMYEELDNKEGLARLRARYDAKHAEFMLMNKKNEVQYFISVLLFMYLFIYSFKFFLICFYYFYVLIFDVLFFLVNRTILKRR